MGVSSDWLVVVVVIVARLVLPLFIPRYPLPAVLACLLVFPNTFEYFFIYYEALRARYNPLRYSQRYWLLVAAAIWTFIKLPQEWWIHIAQFDTTDLIKQRSSLLYT